MRLVRGNLATATIFSDDPAGQARRFADTGFSWLHVVDLDGAFAGDARNAAAVAAIRAATNLRVQFGGGIRDQHAIEHWLGLGIDRVVLGTAALRNPDLVRRAAADHPGAIAVAIDARDGRVAIEGWAQVTEVGVIELARRFEGCGVAAIIYTDVSRDGTMTGVDAEAVAEIARQIRIPVIASGGVASLADIAAVKRHEQDGIIGLICGRAMYDGRINPAEALGLLAEAPRC